MRHFTEPTYQIHIYLSGPIEVAKQMLREYVAVYPKCVTIDPTTFLYTGGEEQGYVVGLLNYPRFPNTPEELNICAMNLAHRLLAHTFQSSALVVTPTETVWITARD